MRLNGENTNIHIDPGPGALLLSKKYGLKPTKLDSLILTHAHPDHYSDMEVLIEAMTKGGTKDKGKVISSKSGLEEIGDYGPAISRYHRRLPKEIVEMNEKKEISLDDSIRVFPKEVKHSDPSAHGFVMESKQGRIGFTSDTEYFEELPNKFNEVRLLVINVTRPINASIPHHLSIREAADLIDEVAPEMAVITHFGMKMLNEGVKKQEKILKKETKQRCIAARDGMKIDLDKTIKVHGKQKKITNF